MIPWLDVGTKQPVQPGSKDRIGEFPLILPGELPVAEGIAVLLMTERTWAVVGSRRQPLGIVTHRELLGATPGTRLGEWVPQGEPLTLQDLEQPQLLLAKTGDREYVLVVGEAGECLGVWERQRWLRLQ
ncbi:MAG: hypothetical protein Q6J18_07535, partial [Gloeomargarita sp. DG02_3_bins_56]